MLLHTIYHKLLICVIHVGNIPKGFLVLQHLPSLHLQPQVVFNATHPCNQCMVWWGIDRGSYLHQFFNNRNVVKDFVQNFQNYKSMLFRKQWEWNHEVAQCSTVCTVTHNWFNKFRWKSMGANRIKSWQSCWVKLLLKTNKRRSSGFKFLSNREVQVVELSLSSSCCIHQPCIYNPAHTWSNTCAWVQPIQHLDQMAWKFLSWGNHQF